MTELTDKGTACQMHGLIKVCLKSRKKIKIHNWTLSLNVHHRWLGLSPISGTIEIATLKGYIWELKF